MCCGRKRLAWRSTSVAAPAQMTAAPGMISPGQVQRPNLGPTGPGITFTRLRYRDNSLVRLRGPVTGQAYTFSAAEPIQEVDVRDAAILVRSARCRLSAP
jgi:hypothetical protein